MTGPIAYLTGQYPRATDTFIQREVAALRAHGHDVMTNTIRATEAAHHVGPEQQAEFAATFQVMNACKNPLTLIRAHAAALVRNPKRWVGALALAWRTKPAGIKAGLWQFFYFLEAGVLAQHLRASGVQHLHNHFADSSCTVAMLSAQISGIPYSVTMHGPGIFFEPLHWRIDEKIARASFVACISHFCRSQGMLFSDVAHWDKLKIVHCGIDPSKYDVPVERSYGKRLLFVGRLDGVKGVPLLLDAVTRLHKIHPELELVVVGDGPARNDLEKQALTLGQSVRFMGYQSQDAVADILSETDMLVLPSFAEGVPVVLMEAMAASLPVVTTQVGGISELVENGVSGFICPPGDLNTLTRRIDDLLRDSALCARMGKAGRAKVVADFDSRTEAAWLSMLIQTSLEGTLPDTLRPNLD
ncbi:Glycosyltransferase involved in cell wall bisynthesis [Cognatiyoonia koreensis]|uniref:Glycosyltransferase involved in cell wall bisynthesis n=1 Tax=Cognatiyoonia koreensis TaxID=364200 RepID=A0A1I0RUJ4_9RHOB|nr:glycosyltransferase family 4 protein [Cognatiyoonia koreensis]SEW44470.1 Glycosyltransferase involved in cell wall bisynthesis [Cognatiyoonia koreensis]